MNVNLKRLLAVPFVAAGMMGGAFAQASPELTLDRAVEIFVDRNLDIESARLQVEGVRADRVAARLRPNPAITVTAENFKFAGDPSFGSLYEFAVSYSETIELGGKRRLRTSVADLNISVAEARLADALRRGIARVRRLYYEAVLARDRVEIASDNREAFEQLVQYNQARFDEGAIAEADLIKVRIERVQFDRTLGQAELARDQAVISLVELLGDGEFEGRRVAGELGFSPMPYDLPQLKAIALDERPDVRAATIGIALAADRSLLERARGSVDISPFVGYKRVASSDTVLLGVSIPLPFHDRNQAGVARAVTGERQAETQLAALRNRTLAEVESAYRGWESARDQVALFEDELLAGAEESYSIAIVAYREGATELLPLLEAQRTRTLVRDQFLQTLFDYRTSILDLELAVGRDLEQ